MKQKAYISYIFNIFKSAAEDIQQFFPNWVKDHPKIKNVNMLSSIKKEIPISDFRIQNQINAKDIDLDQNPETIQKYRLDNYIGELVSILKEVESGANSSSIPDDIKSSFFDIVLGLMQNLSKRELIYNDIKKSGKIMDGLKIRDGIKTVFNFETPKGIFPKTINIPSGTSMTAAFKLLLDNYIKYIGSEPPHTKTLMDITKLKHFYMFEFSLYKMKFNSVLDVVFSTKPQDLLRMSISSEWSSCQNLLKDQDDKNIKAIFSSVSPYTGIIYLTNTMDYEGRGEEMIARSLVFYLQNEDNKSEAIAINKIYTNSGSDIKIQDLFIKLISEKTNLPVLTVEQAQEMGYFFPSENAEEVPYFDNAIKIRKPIVNMKKIDEDWD